MSKYFESIKQGLVDAIEYESGNRPNTKVDKLTISPVYIHDKYEIKQIRNKLKMTQKLFAAALGVSVKTVEAWEAGTNPPTNIANRMLELLSKDNELFERCDIVARQNEMNHNIVK
jgi:putative transcriptional regulator